MTELIKFVTASVKEIALTTISGGLASLLINRENWGSTSQFQVPRL